MSLRTRLVLAMLPLLAALLLVAGVASTVTARIGRRAVRVVDENYRSILAAQRMEESAGKLEAWSLDLALGRPEPFPAAEEKRFDDELAVQEGNITEPGERDATAKLRASWTAYRSRLHAWELARGEPRASWLSEVQPLGAALRQALGVILTINEDALVRKTEAERAEEEQGRTLVLLVAIGGTLAGLFTAATVTDRMLRPVAVLAQAARRITGGDLAARALVSGKDEVARLASEFNAIAERLQKYRESSLGELLEAQAASQATIDSLPDPVMVMGSAGDVLHVNRAAESLLGITVEKGLGGLDPAAKAAVEKVHQHVVSGRGAWLPRGLADSVRLRTPEGERFLLARAAPVYGSGGSIAAVTVLLQDVTRSLHFEELRSNLVATVAHEFRTPLTSLRMAIHLLAEQAVGPLTDKQADLIYASRDDCERLQSIVDELLDLSRIQAGRIELRTEEVDLEKLVSEAIDGQAAPAEAAGVSLRSELLPGAGKVVADPERVQLVFANLLSNAIRHSPKGSPVAIRARSEDGDLRVEVVDQGPGIAHEYHQAIFEKYFQMPGTTGGGAGLGLFIAREIVQAHGGKIGVESEPGRGATFWFTLKRAAAEQEEAA